MCRKLAFSLLFLAVVGGLSCQVVDTANDEDIAGRGAKAFDPYEANASGAIRLSLQLYNGCAIRPDGQMAGRGSSSLTYSYPDCDYRWDQMSARYLPDPKAPALGAPIKLVTGTNYFLNQLTIIDSAWGKVTSPNDLSEVAQWFRGLSKFSKLDWSNLDIISDEWSPSDTAPSPYAWQRRVEWGNASWQKVTNDSFKVEVLDGDGAVRATADYQRSDFLVQNPATHHSELVWAVDGAAAPTSPDDTSIVPAPTAPPGFPPNNPLTFHSLFKIELETSTNPTEQLDLPKGLTGDGVIRITWSQLPNDPFYVPVRFVSPDALPATCYSGANWKDPVPCSFGVVPVASFSTPRNGQFYVPGETVQVHLAVKDSNGNYLTAKDHFPSWSDFAEGQSNGLVYFNTVSLSDLEDYDIVTGWQVSGPKQDMRPLYALNQPGYYRAPTQQYIPGVGNEGLTFIGTALAAVDAIPGAQEAYPPTTWSFTIPQDAQPGTYTLYWKVHRYFMGERFTKLAPFDFQVGQKAPTQFPGRVGNCQICHRGPESLENVRHGLSVNYIEGCKTCHVRDAFVAGRDLTFQRLIHRIHMSSSKYPLPKNQCTVCHLTRESALRPSYLVCGSCHFQPHGSTFQSLETTTDLEPSITNTVYGDCGSACHATTPPTQHILPVE